MAKQKCVGCNPYTEFYPGDKYVDYMGFSAFNWGAIEGRSWVSMYDSMKLVTNHLTAISNKPIIVAETATNDVGGDKGAGSGTAIWRSTTSCPRSSRSCI